jgi:hypothetical protein
MESFLFGAVTLSWGFTADMEGPAALALLATSKTSGSGRAFIPAHFSMKFVITEINIS